MIRATTPTHTFKFPSEITVSDITELILTYAQRGNIILEKELSDLTAGENNDLYYTLTQAETKLFNDNIKAEVQLRIKVGSAVMASPKYSISITDVLNDEEM